jgi:hypothetical protein
MAIKQTPLKTFALKMDATTMIHLLRPGGMMDRIVMESKVEPSWRWVGATQGGVFYLTGTPEAQSSLLDGIPSSHTESILQAALCSFFPEGQNV